MVFMTGTVRHLPGGAGSIVPHPLLHGRRVEVPPLYLSHDDPRLRSMADNILQYGAVYQEESLSLLQVGTGFLPLP